MALPHFQYLALKTMEETLVLMASHSKGFELLAGGTEILGRLKHPLIRPSHIISLRNVQGLKCIELEGNEIIIGSMTTLQEIAELPAIGKACKALSQAADAVAAPSIQNIATLGGNLLEDTRCLQYNQ